jgi:hypothetical protein
MATTTVTMAGRPGVVAGGSTRARSWRLQHYLACLGIVFLIWETWTLVAWLADGPRQITEFRDRSSASWYAARFYEALAVVLAIGVGASVIRGCRRAGKLTFDALFVIAAALTYWQDPMMNFFSPIFMYNSNWINLSNWTGHIPFWINPDAGRMPEPVLAIGLFYTFGVLFFVRIINLAMTRAHRRWPELSTAQLVVGGMLLMMILDIALELPAIALRMWSYPGLPNALSIFGDSSTKLPLVEVVAFGVVIGGFAALRYCKNDRGETIIERGSQRATPSRSRHVVTLLALVGFMNGGILLLNGSLAFFGLYATQYKPLPAYIVNDMCGPETRYGPCPGDPGYRMPLRGSLSGPKP